MIPAMAVTITLAPFFPQLSPALIRTSLLPFTLIFQKLPQIIYLLFSSNQILSKVIMQNLKFAKSVWYTTLWPSIRCNVVSSQVIELFVTYSCLFTDTKIYVEHLDKYKVKENKVWVWVERESYHDSSIYFHHYSFGIW